MNAYDKKETDLIYNKYTQNDFIMDKNRFWQAVNQLRSNRVEAHVRRTPIYLGKNAIAVLHIFTRYDHLEDTWMFDSDALRNQNWKLPEESAQQFIEQLEKWWTPAFMMQLRDQVEKELIKHDKKYKTKFAKRSA